jgi:hypothetical protein
MAPRNDRTREWARLGANTRLQEIENERAAILKEFPELRHGRLASGGGSTGRRKLSAAARRKLSAGMRKYWARRRAQAASKSASRN